MLRPISRITHACLLFVLGPGLTLGALPQFGGIEIEARKKKAKAPGIATQSIVLAPHVDRGHKTVVVTVANIGKRGASSVRIAMQATRSGGAVRKPEVSGPLSVTKGETTTVEFHLGCHWINGGAVTAHTDPSHIPGEPNRKAANNTLTQAFGEECPVS